jgi:hypothetical protein
MEGQKKKKKKPESFYVLGYLLELILKKFQIWRIWAFFPIENPMYGRNLFFFRWKLAKYHPKERKKKKKTCPQQ